MPAPTTPTTVHATVVVSIFEPGVAFLREALGTAEVPDGGKIEICSLFGNGMHFRMPDGRQVVISTQEMLQTAVEVTSKLTPIEPPANAA